jgi:hypothetical protein
MREKERNPARYFETATVLISVCNPVDAETLSKRRTGSFSNLIPLDLVKLSPLMERGEGRPEIRVALIDGPVALGHPDLYRRRDSRNSWKSQWNV